MDILGTEKKRGPAKKSGFRQELRITTQVEKAFIYIKEKYMLKNNSEALNMLAELYLSGLSDKSVLKGN